MALKAACPGVSKNVTDPDLIVTLKIETKLISVLIQNNMNINV